MVATAFQIDKAHAAMNNVETKKRALDALAGKFIEGLDLVEVDRLPIAVYGFNPEGWTLFVLRESRPGRTGCSEYVAVKRASGKVRFLGEL